MSTERFGLGQLNGICNRSAIASQICRRFYLADGYQKARRTGEQSAWSASRERQLESKLFEKASSNFLEKCFVNGLPTAFQSGTHKVVENQSLLPYQCLILGDRLPKEYRKNMIDKLKCGRFITDHGFATESLDSNCYRT